MTNPTSAKQVVTGYAPVNGLNMYYEIHGTGQPLVLLHGAMSGIETSFGAVLPGLAQTRQVIAVELQAHGRTADVDRPLSIPQLADDTVALLRHLGLENVDLFGYSMGAGVALEIAIRYPEIVRKLVTASVSYTIAGMHPGLLEGIEALQPEHLAGTPFEAEYLRLAPKPENWAALIHKVKRFDASLQDWTAAQIQSIQAPTLLMIGDSDIIQPEHAVEMFRLLGGGVAGDSVGLPKSQLAILPGTTHITIMYRADLLLSMIPAFLDTPTQ